MPPSTTPATPGTARSTVALSMWQLLVPITITSVPGSAAPAPGTPACASIVAALTGIPAGKSESFGHMPRRAVRPCCPAREIGPAFFLATTLRKRRMQGAEELGGWETVTVMPQALVSGLAGRTRQLRRRLLRQVARRTSLRLRARLRRPRKPPAPSPTFRGSSERTIPGR